MTTMQIAIYGAGGCGRAFAWLAEECSHASPYHIVCFVDDNVANQGRVQNGIPTLSLDDVKQNFADALLVGAVGNPSTRQLLMEKAAVAGYGFATLVHPRVERSRRIEIGEGTMICAGNILTTNITLGRHVQINLDCTIGHDVIMGDYTTLAPGVHVSGCVHFGKRVYIGTGVVIINGTMKDPIVIEDDAVVGAGACVTKSVASGLTVVGVPARPLQPRG